MKRSSAFLRMKNFWEKLHPTLETNLLLVLFQPSLDQTLKTQLFLLVFQCAV